MSQKKAIKQHYNKILKDGDKRKQHFSKGGALGSEREGRTREDRIHAEHHNESAERRLGPDHENPDKLVEKLKEGKKITLGR